MYSCKTHRTSGKKRVSEGEGEEREEEGEKGIRREREREKTERMSRKGLRFL